MKIKKESTAYKHRYKERKVIFIVVIAILLIDLILVTTVLPRVGDIIVFGWNPKAGDFTVSIAATLILVLDLFLFLALYELVTKLPIIKNNR